jgi:hypothetical protein
LFLVALLAKIGVRALSSPNWNKRCFSAAHATKPSKLLKLQSITANYPTINRHYALLTNNLKRMFGQT